MNLSETYSFDDILITPKYSEIRSRKDVSLKTQLTKNISINIPIISSPMDTVTEDKMAIAMAMAGGIGIIHRFQNIESHVQMVNNVKRHLSYIIENPYTINQNATIDELINLSNKYNVSGIIVVDDYNKFIGIVSKKDVQMNILLNNNFLNVKDIMTPHDKVIKTDKYDYNIILDLYKKHKIEKIPIIDNDNTIKGLVVFKNLMYFHNNKHIASLDSYGRLLVGAAVGATGDYIERTRELVKAGVDIICIDIANGHNILAIEAIKNLKNLYPNLPIMAGNVCTGEGYEALCLAGADCIRVGIGNGSICSTRVETGVGVCQFTALKNCSLMAKKYNIPMISDGGHTGKTGNKFKALAIGASYVMLGKSLAGTTESPGNIIYKSGKRFKYYRGMASAMANISKQEKQGLDQNLNTNFHVEGVDGIVEYKGSVHDELMRICNGIKSGMSYLGVDSIEKLHNIDIIFTKVTQSGYKETITRI